MKKKILFGLLVFTLVALPLCAACAEPTPEPSPAPPTPAPTPPTPAPEPEVIKIIAHTTTPPVAAPGICLEEWSTKLEEMSGGKVEVVRYFASALFEQREAIRSMLAGTADVHFDYMAGEDPGLMKLNLYMDLPFLGYTSPAQGTKTLRGLLENIPEMKAEFQGLKLLYPVVYSTTSYLHSTKRQVLTSEDLKGLKFISHGWSAKWYEKMGATAVKLSWPDFYTSYEKGVVDSMTSNFGPHIGSGMIELSKYHTHIPTAFSIGTIVNLMNADSFNSLPPDIQKIIEDLDSWYLERRTGLETDLDVQGVAMAKEAGHGLAELSPEVTQEWMDAAKPLHEEWIEEKEGEGLPARHFFEELKRLQEQYK